MRDSSYSPVARGIAKSGNGGQAMGFLKGGHAECRDVSEQIQKNYAADNWPDSIFYDRKCYFSRLTQVHLF